MTPVPIGTGAGTAAALDRPVTASSAADRPSRRGLTPVGRFVLLDEAAGAGAPCR